MLGVHGLKLEEGVTYKISKNQTNPFYGKVGYKLPAGTNVRFVGAMEQPRGGYGSMVKCEIVNGPHAGEFAALEPWILAKV